MAGPDKEIDAHSGVETTGHEWDGIKELNNPLPRWWLWIFYATIVWSVVYMVFMPAIPGLPGSNWHSTGTRGHSDRANVAADLEALKAQRGDRMVQLASADLNQVMADPELLRFALAAGESAFGDNCATCHGAGGQGFIGYPNLNDDAWLWGGSLEDIRHTLRVGIRSGHPETRYSQMPAYGDGILNAKQIEHVADYVLYLGGARDHADQAALQDGRGHFTTHCVTCHTERGTGDQAQGAPDLTDQIWLYGGEREQIIASITRGPFGVMPAWEGRLDDATINALAVYVYSRGVGESPSATAALDPALGAGAAEGGAQGTAGQK